MHCIIHCFPQIIASDQRTHVTAKEIWQLAHVSVIHCSYQVAHHCEARRLIACWDAFEISRLTFLDTYENVENIKAYIQGLLVHFI